MRKAIRGNTNPRQAVRLARKVRIHKKIVRQRGQITRLVVYRSNRRLYAQVVDDQKGHTLVWAHTDEEVFKKLPSRKNLAAAKELGKLIGSRALSQKIERVLFDRNGYDYHGRVKAIAEGAREAGLRV